jgi:hypothetical protein
VALLVAIAVVGTVVVIVAGGVTAAVAIDSEEVLEPGREMGALGLLFRG